MPSGWDLVLCGTAVRSRRRGAWEFREEEVKLGIAGEKRQRRSPSSEGPRAGLHAGWGMPLRHPGTCYPQNMPLSIILSHRPLRISRHTGKALKSGHMCSFGKGNFHS